MKIILSPIKNVYRGSKKFSSLIPIYGLTGTAKLIIRNIFWVEKVYRLEKDLNTHEKKVMPKIPMIVTPCSSKNYATWEGKSEILKIRGHYGLTQFDERLNRGDILFTAYWNLNFIGFVWLTFSTIMDVGYELRCDEAYTYDAWTFEMYRGKRTLPVIQQTIFSYLRTRHKDVNRVVTHIATWNKASISGDTRAGYNIKNEEISFFIFGYHKKIYLRLN